MQTTKPHVNSLIKVHGGKSRLCSQIINKMEYRPIYVEGFVAGASVLLNIADKFEKVYAFDLDHTIISMWLAVRDHGDDVRRILSEVKYSVEAFNFAMADPSDDLIVGAAKKIIKSRFSRGGLSKTFGESSRKRGGQDEYKNAWDNFRLNHFPLIQERIQSVSFQHGCYRELCISNQLDNNPNCVFYLDPPYIFESRTVKKVYQCEMPTFNRDVCDNSLTHEGLLGFVKKLSGLTYLSGYPSSLYDELLTGYQYYDFFVKNNSGQNKIKESRTERLWCINGFC